MQLLGSRLALSVELYLIFYLCVIDDSSGYSNHGPLEAMGVTGVSPLAMMSMHEQYPWMKEKKSSRKNQMQGWCKRPKSLSEVVISVNERSFKQSCGTS